jgi:predicted NAD/FAD-dependent oxidoreductase
MVVIRDTNQVTADVIIIGAGISGLLAARQLQNAGLRVTIMDKSVSVGGRLATRRVGTGVADHGAQFFTVRDPKFGALVEEWIAKKVVFLWSHGFSDGSLNTTPTDGHPRYAVNSGMNNLAKYLAEGLQDVRLNHHIVTATYDEQGWIFQDEDANLFTSYALIMTPPMPQTLKILDEGATFLPPEQKSRVETIEYAPCLTGIFWIEGGRVTLPAPGAIQRRTGHVTWIGDNHQKGISPNGIVVTVQASEDYSRQLWDAPDERILNALLTDLRIFMDERVHIREAQLKRWRYSRPLNPLDELCMVVDIEQPLILAGDAFGGARVEGAALSGLAAADAMLHLLNK